VLSHVEIYVSDLKRDETYIVFVQAPPDTIVAGYDRRRVGLNHLAYLDGTMVGGSSPVYQIGHAAAAIAVGKCKVALVSLANRPRSEQQPRSVNTSPESSFEMVYGSSTLGMYALAAQRHMYEFGTTSEQLAWVKVAFSEHAQYNPHALLRKTVTAEELLNSPILSEPLLRRDIFEISRY